MICDPYDLFFLFCCFSSSWSFLYCFTFLLVVWFSEVLVYSKRYSHNFLGCFHICNSFFCFLLFLFVLLLHILDKVHRLFALLVLHFYILGIRGHARNFPNLPYFTTIILPHFSHGISVTSSSNFTCSSSFSTFSTVFANGP